MNISLSVHKFIEALHHTKISSWQIFFAFVCSLNLWFLNIYFFHPQLYLNEGITITLLTSLALAVPWCIVCLITVQYAFRIQHYQQYPNEAFEITENSRRAMNISFLSETLLLHSIFLWLEYLTGWGMISLLPVQFLLIILQNLLSAYWAVVYSRR